MRKLIILRGNSGSGKTTVAKELQSRFGRNTMLISQDMVRREILKVKDGENTQAIPLMKELLIYGNKHSEIVILEGIMYADWYKPLFELAVRLYGINIYAYYFDLTFEETLKRHQTKPNCHEFGEEAMRRWWREKDYSDILNEVSITAEKSMDSIVNNIYDTVCGKGERE
ncbi:MAG: kinase [Lachnospiraceae bacterium]|nr:kinase [Lachnospiraceae bacterium]